MMIETSEGTYPNLDITATYSAEDNKLRLYASDRLPEEIYNEIKKAGFKWAPKQQLFVAGRWTPGREDICLTYADEITAEQSTLVDRAEAKAERYTDLAIKRASEANQYFKAADSISQRFAAGQPILVGHHSERGARRDQKRMHAAMDNAVKAQNAISYWTYKAKGSEHYANMKNSDRTRINRIKTLLKDLRAHQRDINHAKIALDLWHTVDAIKDQDARYKAVVHHAGTVIKTGELAPWQRGRSVYDRLICDDITAEEAIDICIKHFDFIQHSAYTYRWISHILNRLAFERSELGMVPKFDGEITKTILQAFARTHGAHKPKATKTSGGEWQLESSVDLPAHIAAGQSIILIASDWCDLMQSVGYEVPDAKPRRKSTAVHAPLINPTREDAEKLQAHWNEKAKERHESVAASAVRDVLQGYFSANSQGDYSPFRTIEIDANGDEVKTVYRNREHVKTGVAVCRVRASTSGGSLYGANRVIIITDKAAKSLPLNWGLS